MQKIFFNNKEIIMADEPDPSCEEKNNCLSIIYTTTDVLMEIFNSFIAEKFLDILFVNCEEKYEEVLKDFVKLFPVMKAGGGLVLNDKEEILFIFRHGKWDLPKGKKERTDESIEDTAVREVEEETGITGLEVIRRLQNTYHFYEHCDELVLKKSYWFEMYSDFPGILIPQKSEDITDARWIDINKVSEISSEMFPSISFLCDNFIKEKKQEYE